MDLINSKLEEYKDTLQEHDNLASWLDALPENDRMKDYLKKFIGVGWSENLFLTAKLHGRFDRHVSLPTVTDLGELVKNPRLLKIEGGCYKHEMTSYKQRVAFIRTRVGTDTTKKDKIFSGTISTRYAIQINDDGKLFTYALKGVCGHLSTYVEPTKKLLATLGVDAERFAHGWSLELVKQTGEGDKWLLMAHQSELIYREWVAIVDGASVNLIDALPEDDRHKIAIMQKKRDKAHACVDEAGNVDLEKAKASGVEVYKRTSATNWQNVRVC